MSANNASTPSRRPHLGKGWDTGMRPVDGRLCYSQDEINVEQAISIILQTAPNERLMNPNFGVGLRNFLFAGNGPVTHRRVEEAVKRALVQWEPRIRVERVTASADEQQHNLMRIEVDYVVRRTNAFYNLVYPFYLSEAG